MKKRGYLRATEYLAGAALCVATAAMLIARFPDAWDSQVLNPVICLAKYVLPAMGLLLLLEGAWSLRLALKGREQYCLAASMMVRLQQHWDRRDRELHREPPPERAARQPEGS